MVALTLVPAAQAATLQRAAVGTHYATVTPACAAPAAGDATCFALVAHTATASTPHAVAYPVRASYTQGPAGGYTPSDLWTGYNLGTPTSNATSTGQTVAIVDAYNDPNAQTDLNTFDAKYGLSCSSCLSVVNQNGQASPLPTSAATTGASAGWDVEISLDVQSVHAVCPNCKILLVEANSSSGSDLATAVNSAVSLGATEVTNSYGVPENTGGDYHTSYNHTGVVITASTGDHGYFNYDDSGGAAANSPAAYNDVVAVGGTRLQLDASNNWLAESVWNNNPVGSAVNGGATGGGCSQLYAAQPWQTAESGYTSAGCANNNRLEADISAIGDPAFGFDIQDSWVNGPGGTGWEKVGGTSLSSPVIAAIWALAGGAHGVAYPAQTLYQSFDGNSSSLHDVTSGGNGICGASGTCANETVGTNDCGGTTACHASTGYDGPSGVGTPVGTAPFTPVVASFTLPNAAQANTSVAVNGSASTSRLGSITSYNWTWGDGTSSQTTSSSTTHTYTTAGVYTVSLTVTAGGVTSGAVNHIITIGNPTAPVATITDGDGSPYGYTLDDFSLNCASSACTWTLVSGSLPSNLTYSGSNGDNGQTLVISGTPSKVQTSTATFTVSQGGVVKQTFTETISAIENLSNGIGLDPTGMVADTTNGLVDVAATKSNAIDVISAAFNPVISLPGPISGFSSSLFNDPVGLAVTPTGTALTFTNFLGTSTWGTFTPAANPTSESSFPYAPYCSEPEGVSYDSSGADLVVGCYDNASSYQLLASNGGLYGLRIANAQLSGIAPTGTSGVMGLADAAQDRFYTYSFGASAVTATVALPAAATPANVAYASVGGTRFDYVADPGTGQFSIVNVSSPSAPTIAAEISLPGTGDEPYGIATDGSSTLVVSDAANHAAYVYTLGNGTTTAYATLDYTIALPASAVPDGVADMTVGGTNLAFIGNEAGNSVTIVDPPLPKGKRIARPIRLNATPSGRSRPAPRLRSASQNAAEGSPLAPLLSGQPTRPVGRRPGDGTRLPQSAALRSTRIG